MGDSLFFALSLCRKAGALTIGFDAVTEKAAKGEARLLLLARDLSDKTRARILRAVENCPAHTLPYTQDELSSITKKPAGVLAVTNEDLAALCLAKLAARAEEETV